MKMDERAIRETLHKGERVTLECKRAKAEGPGNHGDSTDSSTQSIDFPNN
jgi:hypothetical protein